MHGGSPNAGADDEVIRGHRRTPAVNAAGDDNALSSLQSCFPENDIDSHSFEQLQVIGEFLRQRVGNQPLEQAGRSAVQQKVAPRFRAIQQNFTDEASQGLPDHPRRVPLLRQYRQGSLSGVTCGAEDLKGRFVVSDHKKVVSHGSCFRNCCTNPPRLPRFIVRSRW